jgi:hypothetical protein
MLLRQLSLIINTVLVLPCSETDLKVKARVIQPTLLVPHHLRLCSWMDPGVGGQIEVVETKSS